MRKVALSDEILRKVEKPARYVGGEVNIVMKDPEQVEIHFAFSFPDVYEVGMSHLGMQVLYHEFNRRQDVYCERVFAPWTDMEEQMRQNHIPLYSLESYAPLSDFDFVGFTLQYEMSFTNILNMLDLGGIPLESKDRDERFPLICAGGPTAYNPEPLAPFMDFFYLGEGEAVFHRIFDAYRLHKRRGASKQEFLESIAGIPGIYIPSFYDVQYHDEPAAGCRHTGTIASVTAVNAKAPAKIQKALVSSMDEVEYPTKPLVPYLQTVHDRGVVEIFRGCIRGCRFCQAGMVYRPVRMRSKEKILELADAILANTGYDELSLTSLSSNDYPDLYALVEEIHRRHPHVNVSLPSLRVDAFSLSLMEELAQGKKSGLTFAPEAGTQRLRNVINKGLDEDEILNGVSLAFSGGWDKVKLYFMLGLPTETEDDVEGIASLSSRVLNAYFGTPKDVRSKDVRITVSTSFFVPKAFTPFQWSRQSSYEEYMDKQQFLQGKIKSRKIQYNCHDAFLSTLEGLMARGDRRTAALIRRAFEKGCRFDSWSDMFLEDAWREAIEECGIELEYYNQRERARDEILPWDHIDVGVTKQFLYRQYEEAQREHVTPHCRQSCSGCGVMHLAETGVCYEERGGRVE